MPVYLEDIQVGQSASVTKTFTEDDLRKFGEVSLDTNPVHFDEEYASKTRFGTRIVHGLLTSSLISGLLGIHLPGEGTIYLGQTLKFKAPVRLNETVVATVTVQEVVAEKGKVTLACVAKVGDTVVLEGEATVLAPRKPA